MNKAISKVCDDVLKTCDFLASAAALCCIAHSMGTRLFGTDRIGNNIIGRNAQEFDNGKKPVNINQ